jgi:uncharacterized protein YdhG (YjbR/CyaY superfamily)
MNEIDQYIAGFPDHTRELLTQLRKTIQTAAPEAKEVISWSMPAFKQNGILVFYAAYKNHIGFYPTASGIEAFKTELSSYKWSKGTIQFPLDKPLPLELITKIVRHRILERMKHPRTTVHK